MEYRLDTNKALRELSRCLERVVAEIEKASKPVDYTKAEPIHVIFAANRLGEKLGTAYRYCASRCTTVLSGKFNKLQYTSPEAQAIEAVKCTIAETVYSLSLLMQDIAGLLSYKDEEEVPEEAVRLAMNTIYRVVNALSVLGEGAKAITNLIPDERR